MPVSGRSSTITLRKKILAGVNDDCRFQLETQLNDGTPSYWYFRRQNGGVVPSLGGPRTYGHATKASGEEMVGGSIVGGGAVEIAASVRPEVSVPGDAGFTGNGHGHEGDWIQRPVFRVDGTIVDYDGAADEATFTGKRVDVTFSYPIKYVDDSANWCNIERTLSLTRDCFQVRQTRTILLNTYILEEFVGMMTVDDSVGNPALFMHSIAIDTGSTGTGLAAIDPAADANYEHTRMLANCWYGDDYACVCRTLYETAPTRLAGGKAGYVTNRTDNSYKSYFRTTEGGANGVLYRAGDTITTVHQWQVYAMTAAGQAFLDSYF